MKINNVVTKQTFYFFDDEAVFYTIHLTVCSCGMSE